MCEVKPVNHCKRWTESENKNLIFYWIDRCFYQDERAGIRLLASIFRRTECAMFARLRDIGFFTFNSQYPNEMYATTKAKRMHQQKDNQMATPQQLRDEFLQLLDRACPTVFLGVGDIHISQVCRTIPSLFDRPIGVSVTSMKPIDPLKYRLGLLKSERDVAKSRLNDVEVKIPQIQVQIEVKEKEKANLKKKLFEKAEFRVFAMEMWEKYGYHSRDLVSPFKLKFPNGRWCRVAVLSTEGILTALLKHVQERTSCGFQCTCLLGEELNFLSYIERELNSI